MNPPPGGFYYCHYSDFGLMRSKKEFKTPRDYLDYAYEQLDSAMEHVHNERQGYPSELESVETWARNAVMAIRKYQERKHNHRKGS